jgi:hypothetical protein
MPMQSDMNNYVPEESKVLTLDEVQGENDPKGADFGGVECDLLKIPSANPGKKLIQRKDAFPFILFRQ